MRLPALNGETQPVASTSGRLHDSYSFSEPCYSARRHRLPLSTTSRRMPALYIFRSTASAMTKTGHADNKLCAVTTAGTGNQHPGQPAVYSPSACSEALFSHACITIWDVRDHLAILQIPKDTTALESVPEHWLKHMQRVADARSMKGYAHPSGHMKQHARLISVHPLRMGLQPVDLSPVWPDALI